MRQASDNLKQVLASGGFTTRLIVDAFYGETRTFVNVPADSYDLKWDSEAQIKAAGTLNVVYSPEVAQSLTPQKFTDTLAPYGQEVNLLLEVASDDSTFSETVQLGSYRITAVPEAADSFFEDGDQVITVGSRVTLTLEDRMVAVQRKGFRSEQNPPGNATCWGEIARLTGAQVSRSVPDKAVPSGTTYLAKQGGVLEAVQDLAGVLGGVAYFTPDGAISVLPDERGPVAAELVLGESGTILSVADSMDSDGVYNVVVGNFTDDDRNPIYAVAELTTGPFSTSGPYGEYTRYYASDFVKTQAAANSAVKAILTQSTSSQAYRVPVQCIINPLIEDGDMVSVQRQNGVPIVGRVVSHSFGSSNMMNLELDVQRAIS